MAGPLLEGGAMIPKAYELKRMIAQHRQRFWCADALADLASAPVYLFRDQERFDSDDVDLVARRATLLKLPHRDVLFEVPHRDHKVTAVVAFVTTTVEDEIVGFLFVRMGSRWTDVQCWAHFTKEGAADYVVHPSIVSRERGEEYGSILTGLVWRALAILSTAAIITPSSISQVRRSRFARPGVSGWTYRIVDIDPRRIEATLRETRGTHASPRWHIRRGHWRTLAGGRGTFVRECEVGDPAQGGVVKDYRVQAEVRA
jgi:hypothetical protein